MLSSDDENAIWINYFRLGWSLIPIRSGTKKPACQKWEQYQRQRPDVQRLRRWFNTDVSRGLAVICGDVSGGLICRDFDCNESYDAWKRNHAHLAAILPTVSTSRGLHVYFCGSVEQVRKFGKTNASVVFFDDGELRGGGYCLLPPSVHPDGLTYEWLIEPNGDQVPFIENIEKAGFLCSFVKTNAKSSDRLQTDTLQLCNKTPRVNTENAENTGDYRGCRTLSVGEAVFDEKLKTQIREIVRATQPTGPGQRHRKIFEIARRLKSIPRLVDIEARHFRPFVRKWHEMAKNVIRTKEWEETWIDFLEGWDRVRKPSGEGLMNEILEKVEHEFDENGVPARPRIIFDNPKARLLYGICRELQLVVGEQPFFLSTDTVAELLSVSKKTAWAWLKTLEHERVIELVYKGHTGRASEYRFIEQR